MRLVMEDKSITFSDCSLAMVASTLAFKLAKGGFTPYCIIMGVVVGSVVVVAFPL